MTIFRRKQAGQAMAVIILAALENRAWEWAGYTLNQINKYIYIKGHG